MRALLWIAGLTFGSLAGHGLLDALGPVHGSAVAAGLLLEAVVVTFVMVSVVTAMEALFPPVRRRAPVRDQS